jgi:integrase
VAERRVPKLCRHKSSGRAYVTDPDTRKPVYLGRWGTAQAAAAYARWLQAYAAREPAAARPPPGPGLTVGQLLNRYLEFARGYYRKGGEPTSHVGLVETLAGHCAALWGRERADSLRVRHVEELQARLIGLGMARSTINKLTYKLVGIYKWAVRREWVPGDVLGRLQSAGGLRKGRSAAREPRKVRPVPVALVGATLPELSPTLQVMVRLQLYGGMRPGEVCGLCPCEVDRSRVPWRYCPASWKTEHHHEVEAGDEGSREVFFGPRSRALLGPLLDAAADPDAPLFLTPRGRPYDNNTYRPAIRRACDRAGVERWSPNRLRHTQATEIRAKYGAEAAQMFLGHERLSTTELYAERSSGMSRKVAEDLG